MYSCCDFIVFYRIIWILEVVWMKYKILVVDDDKEIAEKEQSGLLHNHIMGNGAAESLFCRFH